MLIALELRGLAKGFVAGGGACSASAQVLRGIDLTVQASESIALVGQSGSGKSTLLLCAAGLLQPEIGEARWFGQSDRAAAAGRAVYYCTPGELARSPVFAEPMLHLVDIPITADAVLVLARWVERRRERGDAVIVSTRDEDFAHHVAGRVVILRGGRLHADTRARSRVAEYRRA
jgi:predicted ABC-type transport system involved in lysophospholipase L1 biosynthesis ATPase subunit